MNKDTIWLITILYAHSISKQFYAMESEKCELQKMITDPTRRFRDRIAYLINFGDGYQMDIMYDFVCHVDYQLATGTLSEGVPDHLNEYGFCRINASYPMKDLMKKSHEELIVLAEDMLKEL